MRPGPHKHNIRVCNISEAHTYSYSCVCYVTLMMMMSCCTARLWWENIILPNHLVPPPPPSPPYLLHNQVQSRVLCSVLLYSVPTYIQIIVDCLYHVYVCMQHSTRAAVEMSGVPRTPLHSPCAGLPIAKKKKITHGGKAYVGSRYYGMVWYGMLPANLSTRHQNPMLLKKKN